MKIKNNSFMELNVNMAQLLQVGFEENLKCKPIWTINPMNKVVVFKISKKKKVTRGKCGKMFQIKKFL